MKEFQKAGDFEFLPSTAGSTRCSMSTTIRLSFPILFFFFLIIIIQFVLAHVVLIASVVHEKFSIKEH